ncbi:PREDICTED: NAD-dependent protein lipoamidase sirtuin-4, mitochondrial-like [Branchiostoma belcheri]|uniref:NAD-dependent protein lipoamidase sirtuin-4, mitochondrial-like n=1 Tax=Branchiostoma belcheri TaxID=7741 RepID=A0A6P4Y8X7_BRABE|nr:PREDICTED: NAD-dependent protein lipoamidase sirtuin-4, mitochondrial-like [Branchiostoma belcheri]
MMVYRMRLIFGEVTLSQVKTILGPTRKCYTTSSANAVFIEDLHFVPATDSATTDDIRRLQEFLHASKRLLVITGAGVSTESGLPDYRSVKSPQHGKDRPVIGPVMYQDFVKNTRVRRGNWARNYVGWPGFSSHLPNVSHRALVDWERRGKLHWLVTQNVDDLHRKAGSTRMTELHGSAFRAVCLSCRNVVPRAELQQVIAAMNPHWEAVPFEIRPDADVALTPEQIEGFRAPHCGNCGGPLKPDMVYFGECVPKDTVQLVFEKLEESDSVLVAGSSLQVYSAFRFVSAAHKQNKPVAILNIGPTRADRLAGLKINGRCGDVLTKINI